MAQMTSEMHSMAATVSPAHREKSDFSSQTVSRSDLCHLRYIMHHHDSGIIKLIVAVKQNKKMYT
jgi:hypothetical protein